LLVGSDGILIRGPEGAGKTRIALTLIERVEARGGFACLVSDDRVRIESAHGRLIARTPGTIAGLVERRGLGIMPIAYEPAAVVSLVVDVVRPQEVERLPADASRRILIDGVELAHLAVPGEAAIAAPLILAALAAMGPPWPQPDCAISTGVEASDDGPATK
jgi:serine kinase of HPr protein (carbohydrate metabolism regulator)